LSILFGRRPIAQSLAWSPSHQFLACYTAPAVPAPTSPQQAIGEDLFAIALDQPFR